MRAALDKLYVVAGALSGLGIVLICVLILSRVVGRWFGVIIPSSDDFAGFLLAASSFLGLAYTFRVGGHIRVSLFTSQLPERIAIFFERGILFLAALLSLFLSEKLIAMVIESWEFNEVTIGYIPIPLWIVQLPMVIGMVIFCIAVIDQLITHLFTGARLPQSDEEKLAHAEHGEATIIGDAMIGAAITGTDTLSTRSTLSTCSDKRGKKR